MGDMKTQELTIAFLGPKASYTHQATKKRFVDKECQTVPLTTIEDVFAAVQGGTATHGVVPFENSSNGSVVFTLDLFADLHGRFPDIVVDGEIYLPVHHCLLGYAPQDPKDQRPTRNDLAPRQLRDEADSPLVSGQVTPTLSVPQPSQPRVKPACDLRHVRKLYSHPQAWGQCKLFLSTYVKSVERQDVSSTSKAAEQVAQDPSRSGAAISSRIAAEMNGLDVLAEGIEDSEGNSTRFFILRRRQDVEPEGSPPSDAFTISQQDRYKSLVSFTVDHGEPGALAKSLAVFERHGLNLTSINTRPSGVTQWNYIFFIEFKGRKWAEGKGGAVNEALVELGKIARSYRCLGSWESMLAE